MGRTFKEEYSMQHWNGNMMCAIDTETTGLDPYENQICQLAILPLNSNFGPIQDIMPLNIHIIPDPSAIDPDAMKVHGKSMEYLMTYGVDREQAANLIVDWLDALPMPWTKKGGHRCRIIPLGCNYAFDRMMITALLGAATYNVYFDSRARDVMEYSVAINDAYAMTGQKVRYSKNNLTWLCKQHGVNTKGAHDALIDCRNTAELYGKMIKEQSDNIPFLP